MKRLVISALLGGAVGGGVVWAIQSGSFSLQPGSLTFEQLASLLLASATLLVTALGVGVGIVALWGYSQFKTLVTDSAQRAAVRMVDEDLKGGELRRHTELVVTTFLQKGFSDGTLLALLEARREEAARLAQLDAGWEEIPEEGHNGE